MAFSTATKNQMLDTLRGISPTLSATHVSLHTADPGTTGANEVVGGAYARKAVTWNSASGGSLDDSSVAAFDVPASTTITHFGLWTASAAGTFVAGGALSAAEAYGVAGTYTFSDLDLTLT